MQYIRQTTSSNLNIHFFIRKIIATIYIFSVLQSTKLTTSHPQFPSLPNLIPSAGEFRNFCICNVLCNFISLLLHIIFVSYHRVYTRLSLQPSELAPPPPHPQASVPPPPFSSKGGGDTLAGGRGGSWSQFGRRDRHSGTLGIV